jgi:hypothetical protein
MPTQQSDRALNTRKGQRGDGTAERPGSSRDRETSTDLEPPLASEATLTEDAAPADTDAVAPRDGAGAPILTAHPTEEEIAAEAYAMYAARNYEDGGDMEDWLNAERRLREAARESGS